MKGLTPEEKEGKSLTPEEKEGKSLTPEEKEGKSLTPKGVSYSYGTCWLMERMLPSGSLNQATLLPSGVVQMPRVWSWANGYFSGGTPRSRSQAATDSMFSTCQPRMVPCSGVKLGILTMRIMWPPTFMTSANLSRLTNSNPSLSS